MRPALLATAVLLCCACSDDRSIALTVGGDLVAGADLDGVDISMLREGAEVWSVTHEVSPAAGLPRTFTIHPSSSDDDAVELVVSATLDRRVAVEATRATAFAHGREVSLQVCLWQRCRDDPSASGCAEGLCDPVAGDGDADGDADGDSSVDGDVEEDGDAPEPLCTDGCPFARDGECQDGGDGATLRWCVYGTDCGDCGARDPGGCVRDCAFRQCGGDGCGGICGPGCEGDATCAPGGACVTWITVAADIFVMGAPDDEVGYASRLETAHEVTLTRDFILAAREVSRHWFESILGYETTSYPPCGECPADRMTWHEAVTFCNVLSRSERLEPCYSCTGSGAALRCELDSRLSSPYECEGYRLPTEAEWELAARAGTTTATYNGDLEEGLLECETPNPILDPIAWFCGNVVPGENLDRALLRPNTFGFYDMLGSTFEWTHDNFDSFTSNPAVDPWGPAMGDTRSLRGGSRQHHAASVRAATRTLIPGHLTADDFGFRVGRTAP